MPSSRITRLLTSMYSSDALNPGMVAMRDRRDELPDPDLWRLIGAAVYPPSRLYLDDRLSTMWETASFPLIPGDTTEASEEVVIGGGLHAAIYCAARALAGHPRPVVLERGTPGGAFAASRMGSYWLNSRNRPGEPGVPGEDDGLNVLPGCELQPADFSAGKFQSNDVMRFAIRYALADYARVFTAADVRSVIIPEVSADPFVIRLANNTKILARRVIDARGGGDAVSANLCDGAKILTFSQMMARMDMNFPLRGMRKVAIVGSGNGALCVAEGLLGLGPSAGMSTASLDYLPRVDMYAPGLPATAGDWLTGRRTGRGRYRELGAYLPSGRNEPRLRVFNERGGVLPTAGAPRVNLRSYSHVIISAGYTLPDLISSIPLQPFTLASSSQELAMKYPGREYYQIGAAAGPSLAYTSAELDANGNSPDNRIALFRLGPRTSALATALGTPPAPRRKRPLTATDAVVQPVVTASTASAVLNGRVGLQRADPFP